MNQTLEALIKAFDAMLEAGSVQETDQRRAIFESHLEDAAHDKGINKDALRKAVKIAHRQWVNKERRRLNLPPID